MQSFLTLIGGAGLGAALMYLFDVDRGRRHRALLRDQAAHLYNKTGDTLDATTRDAGHRLTGLFAGTRSRLLPEDVSDEVLVERIRSKLGRIVSHPSAIEVDVSGGHVVVSGPILAHETGRLLSRLRSTPGVRGVRSRLEEHAVAGDVPGLQGEGTVRGEGPLARQYWPPSARFAAGALGGALTLAGLRQGGFLGYFGSFLGLGFATRALTNTSLRRLLGFGGRRAVDFHKTITVDAPVAEVYDFWSHVENFPRFMSHLEEVRNLGGGRSHWAALGPGGTKFEWEAAITEAVPEEVLAWKSVPGSAVPNAGSVKFRPTPGGGTQLDIHMSYNPPAGALGHVIASLFGTDPKHAMDEDLARLKSLFVHGKTTAHGEQVTTEDVESRRRGPRAA